MAGAPGMVSFLLPGDTGPAARRFSRRYPMTVLDLGGEELAVGHVVSCLVPGSGDDARGYIVGFDGDVVRVHITVPARMAGNTIEVHGSSCTLQHGANLHPLVMRERPGAESGLAEVEAA